MLALIQSNLYLVVGRNVDVLSWVIGVVFARFLVRSIIRMFR